MDFGGVVVSITTFILNSIIFSGFIIPQSQKLKEIKDDLFKLKLTSTPEVRLGGRAVATRDQRKEEIENLQEKLDIYRVRSDELKELKGVFYFSILLAFVSLMAAAILVVFEAEEYNSLVLVAHGLGQLFILTFLVEIYISRPDRISDIGYLVRELSINPHSLINALRLQLHYSAGNLRPSREDPLHIYLSTKLRAYGFRYFYAVADESLTKLHYVSFGPIDKEKMFSRRLIPGGEQSEVKLGSFQFGMIGEPGQEAKVRLFIFLPIFRQENTHPFVADQQQSVGVALVSSDGGMWPVRTDRKEEKISCRGKGVRIDSLEVDDGDSDIFLKAVNKYRAEFMKTRRIREYGDVSGNLLG